MDPLYLDTSCLLKIFVPEPETQATLERIDRETEVVVSTLAHLDALVQVHARLAGGSLSRAAAARLLRRMDRVLASDPFVLVALPAAAIEIAASQLRRRATVHCRTLDRLHLAAMEALQLRRLLTSDGTQAAAARALGFEVIQPLWPE